MSESPSQKRKRLKAFSKKLNRELPKSEIWFWKKYAKLKHSGDLKNKPFQNQYIPDVCNHLYKYIVEVDGSIHNLAHIKEHDKKKEKYYDLHGYRIFRVIGNDNNSFNSFIYQLYQLRDIPYLRKALEKKKRR